MPADAKPPDRPPHLDAAQWDGLIESIGPASIVVLISSWMSERLRRYCTAEDVWQETLYHAWRDRDKHEWRGVKEYRSWLLQVARNRIHDLADHVGRLKRGGEQKVCGFETVVAQAGRPISELFPQGSTTPSRVAMHSEQAESLRAALESLPDELREVVRLHLFEELPMETITERLGIGLAAGWYRFRKGAELYAASLKHLQSTRAGRAGPTS